MGKGKYALLLLILLVACESKSGDVKVGVMIPKTGLAANLGEEVMRGFELASKEAEVPLNLVVEDDQCDAKVGVLVAKKLIEEDGVDAILGSVCTVAILSSAPYIEDQKIPTITLGLVLQKTAEAGDDHFSFLPEMKYQMKAISGYVKNKGWSTVGALAVNDDLGRESIAELKKALEEQGIGLTAEEYFDKSEADFRPYLLKVMEKKPEALYVMGYAVNLVGVVKQVAEWNVSVPILTWNLYQDPSVLTGLGSLAEQVVYTYPEDPKDLPVKTAFKKKFKATYGSEPTLYAANAYDSYKILAAALKECGKDHECIKNKLYAVKNHEGANGYLSVDSRGVGQRSEVSLKTVKSGSFITIS